MLRSSPRRTQAIVTQAIALIVALASDLKHCVTKQAQSKASNCRAAARTSLFHALARWHLFRARGDSADQKAAAAKWATATKARSSRHK
jgi:hypothetical protein